MGTRISDLAHNPCHIAGCEAEPVCLPFPFCGEHNAMAKKLDPDTFAKAEDNLKAGVDGVRGGYRRWRLNVCRLIDAVNAKVREEV